MTTLRITGGSLRGMSIGAMPGGDLARYTSSKVRQAVFNMLGDIEGLSVLELFSGSGSFSIEALSRGAASATLVEANRKMKELIAKNLEKTGLNKYCEVLHMDVRYAVPLLHGRKRSYDIIFMDPPYEMGYVVQTMTLLETHPLYSADTTIIAEYSKREADSLAFFAGTEGAKTRMYSDTVISIIRRETHPGR